MKFSDTQSSGNLYTDPVADFTELDIKKVLIVSDSHRNNRNLFKVIERLNGYMDLMVHLGDMECDPRIISEQAQCPVCMVRGNCDFTSELPESMIIHMKDHSIFATHGTRFSGYGDDELKEKTAEQNGCDIFMSGHTHRPFISDKKKIKVINPGSISRPRQSPPVPTYMVMNTGENGKLEFVKVNFMR